MANESCCPLKLSVWADKKDLVYGQRLCSIILLCPLPEENGKTRKKLPQNKGAHTIKFQLSTFTSVFSLCANLEGEPDDNMVSSVLVLHHINH